MYLFPKVTHKTTEYVYLTQQFIAHSIFCTQAGYCSTVDRTVASANPDSTAKSSSFSPQISAVLNIDCGSGNGVRNALPTPPLLCARSGHLYLCTSSHAYSATSAAVQYAQFQCLYVDSASFAVVAEVLCYESSVMDESLMLIRP